MSRFDRVVATAFRRSVATSTPIQNSSQLSVTPQGLRRLAQEPAPSVHSTGSYREAPIAPQPWLHAGYRRLALDSLGLFRGLGGGCGKV